MIRFVHTADWQLGMKALQAGEKAAVVRDARFEAVARAMRIAVEEKVDFIVVAGDTFEHPDVDDAVVRRAVDLMGSVAPIPVYVLPGNHDPLVPGGVWDRLSWKRRAGNVRLLDRCEEVPVGESVALYPCPLTQKRSPADPTSWIPPRAAGDTRVRVGVAHGSLAMLPERVNFPISGTRVQAAGLDYLALGDWHGRLVSGHVAYSGAIEQTAYDERDPGHILLVEIDGVGALPRVRSVRVGWLRWLSVTPIIQDATDVEQLEQDIGSPESLLLRVSPQVADECPPPVIEALESLRARLGERVLVLDWAERPVLGRGTLEGVFLEVDEALEAVLEGRIPDGPGREFVSADRDVARESRVLLHRLSREVAI